MLAKNHGRNGVTQQTMAAIVPTIPTPSLVRCDMCFSDSKSTADAPKIDTLTQVFTGHPSRQITVGNRESGCRCQHQVKSLLSFDDVLDRFPFIVLSRQWMVRIDTVRPQRQCRCPVPQPWTQFALHPTLFGPPSAHKRRGNEDEQEQDNPIVRTHSRKQNPSKHRGPRKPGKKFFQRRTATTPCGIYETA